MAIVKTFSPSGWDFDAAVTSLVKIASGGLRGNDRKAFEKRAAGSESVFLPFLDSVKFAADEQPAHCIAVGAFEAWGANRNGDAFMEKACQEYHDTFVKFAKFYRNHKNKDPLISYGVVKLSAYNPHMRRIELLIGLNKTKEAAERNHGLLADRELQKLANDGDLAVSMACRVPYDVCSYCGNMARTREDYCTGDMCKAGGCKDNLTKIVKVANDLHRVHVKNLHPIFFDISDVYRPADYACYGAAADYLTKAAADHGFFGVSGAKAAQDLGVMAPLAVTLYQDCMGPGDWTPYLQAQLKLAHALDMYETCQRLSDVPMDVRKAFTADMQPPFELSRAGLDGDSIEKVAAGLGALADKKVILPLRDFARMTKRAELIDDAGRVLSGVYGRMIADGSLEKRLTGNKYAPAEKLAEAKQRHTASECAETYSLDRSAVGERMHLAEIRHHAPPPAPSTEKRASDSPLAEELARDYAVYKVACLHRIAQFDNDFPLTARIAICQNHVV